MQYAIVRTDQLDEKLRLKLQREGKLISPRELTEMNAAARIEVARGRNHLNAKLITATDSYVLEELVAQMKANEVKK